MSNQEFGYSETFVLIQDTEEMQFSFGDSLRKQDIKAMSSL